MKPKHFVILLSLLLITLLTSACSGRRRLVASGWAGVTTNQETAYLAYNNFVYAIDIQNGQERWHFPQDTDQDTTFYAPPALTDDGQLIIGGYDGVLYSLNPENGQVNWTFEDAQGRYIAGPVATQDGIFATSADHHLYAINFDNRPLWPPFASQQEIWARPTTDNHCDCVYIASMDKRIYAIDTQNGTEIWRTNDLGGAIVGTPAVSPDNKLYAGTFGKEMIAINRENGSVIWRYPAKDWVWAGPALQGDTLYFGDLSGTLHALNRQSGELLWEIQPSDSIVGTPLVTENAIYITAEEGLLVSVNPEGTIRWRHEFEGNTHAGPVTANGLILVATSESDSLLVALDSNGNQKWAFAEPEEE